MRVVDADAAGVELEPVVRTLDAVAFMPSFRQRREAVRAAVEQGVGNARGVAEKHERFAQQGTTEKIILAKLVIPCRDIPAVPQKSHIASLHAGNKFVKECISRVIRRPIAIVDTTKSIICVGRNFVFVT
jgi:hypothetical protein